jgi:hypothetical protein
VARQTKALAPADQPKSPVPFNKFDEYKFFVEDTNRLSDRRQTVTNTYISINSAIIGLITFLVAQGNLAGIKLGLISFPIIVAGIVVCYFWEKLLLSYRQLLNFRFEKLKEMEGEMDGCHKLYQQETERFFGPGEKSNKLEFTKVELRLPIAFIALYVLGGLFIVLSAL